MKQATLTVAFLHDKSNKYFAKYDSQEITFLDFVEHSKYLIQNFIDYIFFKQKYFFERRKNIGKWRTDACLLWYDGKKRAAV